MTLKRITDEEIQLTHDEERGLLESERRIAQKQLEADKAQIPAIERAAMERVMKELKVFIDNRQTEVIGGVFSKRMVWFIDAESGSPFMDWYIKTSSALGLSESELLGKGAEGN